MNGVIRASVSPGSSQRETSVTWTPMVRVPSGAAMAGDAPARIAAMRTATSEERTRISRPPGAGGVGNTAFVSVTERLPYRSRSDVDLRKRRSARSTDGGGKEHEIGRAHV